MRVIISENYGQGYQRRDVWSPASSTAQPHHTGLPTQELSCPHPPEGFPASFN